MLAGDPIGANAAAPTSLLPGVLAESMEESGDSGYARRWLPPVPLAPLITHVLCCVVCETEERKQAKSCHLFKPVG